jgi:hypothetical protein
MKDCCGHVVKRHRKLVRGMRTPNLVCIATVLAYIR